MEVTIFGQKAKLHLRDMMNFNFIRTKSFGIDLGNNNTLITDSQKVLVAERSCIVMDRDRQHVKAIGDEAYEMFEKTHALLKPVKPLRGGVIADQTNAERMIRGLVEKACGPRTVFGRYDHIISGVPFDTTHVERMAVRNSLEQFNSNTVSLLYEPLAAALGMDLNIAEPDGKMIVDIGGGITEIVIISLSGIAAFHSLHAAGDTMDEDIRDHFRQRHHMLIGAKTAEELKIRLGTVRTQGLPADAKLSVKGKDLQSGIPVTSWVHPEEIAGILWKTFERIETAMIQTLEKCPPELAADIYNNGIHITGGNARLKGIKERFERKLKLPIHIDENALLSVTKGLGKALADPKKYTAVLQK